MEKIFFSRENFFSRKNFFHGTFFVRHPGDGPTSPGRSGQVRPGPARALRTAQDGPAEPGCGVTPNQNDPGTARGGFDRAKAVGGFFAQRETPGSLERGNVPSSWGGRGLLAPQKPRGTEISRLLQTVPLFNKLRSDRPRTGYGK